MANENVLYPFGKPVSIYTNEQAIADGIKVRLGERLFATTNLLVKLAPQRTLFPLSDTFDMPGALSILVPLMARYMTQDFGDAEDVTRHFAVYTTPSGEIVWFILDDDGLTLLSPEDY